MLALPPTAVSRHPRAGLSLLEVLVACGILAIGLASVSALLPAASARLGQATEQDRGGVLAANARAECVNRGLVAADIFSSATTACVFGELAARMPATGVTASVLEPPLTRMGVGRSRSTSTGRKYKPRPNNSGASSLVLAGPASGDPIIARDTPLNGVIFIKSHRYLYRGHDSSITFTNLSPTLQENIVPTDDVFVVDTSTGFQLGDDSAFRWGAMLTPESGTAAAGLPATLSIAVFRKGATISGTIALTGTSASPRFQLATGLAGEANRRRFLPACSHAVALTNPPRWVRVTSSWTMPGFVVANGTITSGTENVNARRSFVVLDPNPLTSGTTVSGTTVNVIGFDGLLRVDHHPVTLD